MFRWYPKASDQGAGARVARRCTPGRTAALCGSAASPRAVFELLETRTLLAQVSWDGGAGTDSWHDALNWSNNAVPTAADDVTLGPTPLAEVRIFANDAVARSLTMEEELRIENSRSLTLTQGAVVNSTLRLGDGDLAPGKLLFSTTPAQSLTGTGRLVFEFAGNATSTASAIEATTNVQLTIGEDFVITGGNGQVRSSAATASIVNLGTITADVNGRTITFHADSSGHISNQGLFAAANGGIAFFNGAYSSDDLGDFRSQTGIVSFGGTLTNTAATLTFNSLTGSPHLASGTTIVGGTISSPDGRTFLPQGSFTLDAVTLDISILVAQSQTATIRNGLTVNGVVTLGDGATFGQLSFSTTAVQSLGGAGQIVFSLVDSITNQAVVANAGVGLTILPGFTIRGGNGQIRAAAISSSILNQGLVSADVPGRSIVLATGSGSIINEGVVQALNGGTLAFDGTYTTASLGDFRSNDGTVRIGGTINNGGAVLQLNALTGSPQLAESATIIGGVISSTSGQTLVPLWNFTLDGVTLNIDLAASTGLNITIRNSLTLNSTLTLGDGGVGSGQLSFTTTVAQTLGGSGQVVFSGNGGFNNVVAAAGVALTIESGMTIRGDRGNVRPASATASIVNEGVIVAEGSGLPITLDSSFGIITNLGIIQASGGGILAFNGSYTTASLGDFRSGTGIVRFLGTLDNSSSTLQLNALTGSPELGTGLTLIGGAISGLDGQTVILVGSTTLVGVTLNVPLDVFAFGGGPNLSIRNGLTLNSTLTLGDGGIRTGLLNFVTTAAQVLGGTGEVVFNSSTSSANQSLVASAGVELTIGPGIVIRGGFGQIATSGAGARVINNGTVSADHASRPLTIVTSVLGGFVNRGRLESPGGTLRLATTGAGSLDLEAGTDVSSIGGTIDIVGLIRNTGHVLTLNAATGPMRFSGGTIAGGTINLSDGVGLLFTATGIATLNNVQVTGDLAASIAGADLQLLGTTRFTRLNILAAGVEVFFASGYTILDEIVINIPSGAGDVVIRPPAPGATLNIGVGGIVRVEPTSVGGVDFGVTSDQVFTNDGSILLLGATTSAFIGPITNNGTLEISGAAVTFLRPLTGFGVFDLAGTATISFASTYSGTVNLQPAGILNGSGNFTLSGILNWTGGAMNGSGITALTSSAELFISGPAPKTLTRTFTTAGDGLWSAGSLTMSGATFINQVDTALTVTAAATIAALGGANQFINDGLIILQDGGGFDFEGNVAFTSGSESSTVISGDLVIDEDAAFDGGVTLTPTGSISGTGNVVFNGAFIWEGGTLAGPGSITVSATGFLSLEGPDNKHLATTMDHYPVAGNWTGGCLVMGGAIFTNRAGASIDVFADPVLDVVDGGGTNTFNNAGLITVHTGELIISVPGTNSGTIHVIPPDTLVFTDSWTYTPASSLEGPGGVNFAGGTHVFPPGTFSITGPITLSGGGLSLDASDLPYYDPLTHTFSGANWTIGPGQTFTLTGGEIHTIAAGASITLGAGASAPALIHLSLVEGSFTLDGASLTTTPDGGTFSSRGTITLLGGALLDIAGSLALEATSSLAMRIDGSLPTLQPKLASSTAAAIDGALETRWADGYAPTSMFDARLLAATSISGEWASSIIAAGGSTDYRTALQTDALGMRFIHTHIADWNNDLAVNVPDIFAFLSSWFAGEGDFDGNGANGVPDIFAYLSAWFAA